MWQFQPMRLMRQPAGRSLVSLLALAIYLFVAAMAASPELHHYFDHDSDDPNHRCAATAIAHGHVDAAPAIVVLVVPFTVGERVLSFESLCLKSPDFWLHPERAPPVCLT